VKQNSFSLWAASRAPGSAFPSPPVFPLLKNRRGAGGGVKKLLRHYFFPVRNDIGRKKAGLTL
jgi:hypothetical protein